MATGRCTRSGGELELPKLRTTPLRTDLKIRISRLLEMSAGVYRKLIKVGRGGEGCRIEANGVGGD